MGLQVVSTLGKIFHIKPKYKEDVKNGIFVLEGEITNDSACDLISKIFSYTDTSTAEITLYINSTGGSMSAGFAICDVLRAISNEVKIICVENTCGIALLVASAGTANKRFYFPGTHFELSCISANISDGNAQVLNGIIEKFILCLSENTGASREEICSYIMKNKLSKDDLFHMGVVRYY